MLGSAAVIAFVATAKPEESRHFYESLLGLRFVEDGPFALVFEAGGTMLRIQKVASLTPAPLTSLGWLVSDIRGTVNALRLAGVVFNCYDGMPQDELGIWTTPDGAAVAWFSDPDGNTLSLTQPAT
jgi:catechol 2,3-dioxygenase-like lactoylglutathione lyase family enzyme